MVKNIPFSTGIDLGVKLIAELREQQQELIDSQK